MSKADLIKTVTPLPYRAYFLPVVGLTIFGFLDSIYLFISHYRVHTDMGYRSFCAITQSLNCDTVSQSPYSILFGVPVSLWGIYGYAFLSLLLFYAWDKQAIPKRIWASIVTIALVFSLTSVFFALVSTYYIRSYCIVCIATYVVNLLVLFFSWLIRRRFDPDSFFSALKQDLRFIFLTKRKTTYLFVPFFASVIAIGIGLPAYWRTPAPPLSEDIPTGFTIEGHPWIGAENPLLTITEFTDYQCFQCKKMHFFLRTLIQQNPGKIRLIHRHFPMDHRFNNLVKESFHGGSGDMSLLAIYAAAQNKFWKTSDFLFEIADQKRNFNTKEIGEKTGLDYLALARARNDPAIRFLLQKDILEGIKLGVRGTPAYLINGQIYTALIPPEVLEKGLK